MWAKNRGQKLIYKDQDSSFNHVINCFWSNKQNPDCVFNLTILMSMKYSTCLWLDMG